MKQPLVWSFALLSLGACVDAGDPDVDVTGQAATSPHDSAGNPLRWPSTSINYYIDLDGTVANASQPGCTRATNEALPPADVADIHNGIALFMSQTPLTFHELTTTPTSANGRVIIFTRWDGTVSHGTSPNPAPAGTAADWQSCIYFPAGNVSPRTVQHEMGHNMGFEHEQSRWDAPSFLTYDMQCVDVDMQGNFAVDPGSSTDTTYGPYDVDSVMHYDSNSLCNCLDASGECIHPTILRKHPKPGCNPATDPHQCLWIDKSPGFSPRDLNAYYFKYEPKLGTSQANEGLGSATAVGDFNGDGLDDLAVGVPAHKSGSYTSGAVYLYRGTDMGLTAWAVLPSDLSNGARFGAALAVADVNNDGADDLFVGAPGQPDATTGLGNVGRVYEYQGHSAQDDRVPPQLTQIIGESQSGLGGAVEADQFGSSLAVARLDGSHWFLAIGAPKKDVGSPNAAIDEGSVFVLRLGNGVWQRVNEAAGTAYAYDNFGASMIALDYTDDSTPDLIIGAPQPGTSHGGQVGLASGGNALAVTTTITDATPEAGGRFGAALAKGDLLGNAALDLAVGAPGKASSAGRVYLYPQKPSATGFDLGNRLGLAGANFPVPPAAGDQFGASLAAGDLGTPGFDDLAIGAPYQNVAGSADQGAIYVISGGNGTTISRARKVEQTDAYSKLPGDDFGVALAIGMFDGSSELVVGAPGRDTEAGNAGAFQLFDIVLGYLETYGAQTHTNH